MTSSVTFSQIVHVSKCESDDMILQYVVLQGSVLGPCRERVWYLHITYTSASSVCWRRAVLPQ